MPERMTYTVTFWGTRGSIPTPGAHTSRYGGNTSCVAMEGPGEQLVILDAVSRLQPGVLGDSESAEADSFSEALLDAPVYTRPDEFRGLRVPEILLGGNHEQIRRWRRREALRRTRERRPDLLSGRNLSDEDRKLLNEIEEEAGP